LAILRSQNLVKNRNQEYFFVFEGKQKNWNALSPTICLIQESQDLNKKNQSLKWSGGKSPQARIRSYLGYQIENKTDAFLPFLIIGKKCIRFLSKNIPKV
jgi:hypothetical protein